MVASAAASQEALCAACSAVAARLGPAAGELVDGGALAAATALVWEEAAWLRLALQVSCRMLAINSQGRRWGMGC